MAAKTTSRAFIGFSDVSAVLFRRAMTARALVHCSCSSRSPVNFEQPPSLRASYEYHQLADLYFCEECDQLKCSRCVTEELSVFYCPNCLFEVSTSVVRGEKNRCARNCFLCPQCESFLGVVASDPADDQDPAQSDPSIGVPPYYLSCAFCRWDSKEIGMQFDKATGLSGTLQKQDDSTPLLLSFEHVQAHLEPHVKAGLAAMQPVASTSTPRPLASSSSSRFGSLHSISAKARSAAAARASALFKDELGPYDPAFPGNHRTVKRKEDARLEAMRNAGSLDVFASLADRIAKGWEPPILVSDLRPTRVPLHAKYIKRCSECKHILSKPESKTASTKFRIKLIATLLMPRVDVSRRSLSLAALGAQRLSAASAAAPSRSRQATERPAEEPLRSGRSYTFELTLSNPLHEVIEVKLELVQPSLVDEEAPFTLSLPASTFAVNACAEQWELDEDEEEKLGLGSGAKARLPTGMLQRRLNRTTVALEASISKDFVGEMQAQMLVSFRYRGDFATNPATDSSKGLSYWVLLQLGQVTASRLRPSGVPMSRDTSNDTGAESSERSDEHVTSDKS